jgi:hypothetical protein
VLDDPPGRCELCDRGVGRPIEDPVLGPTVQPLGGKRTCDLMPLRSAVPQRLGLRDPREQPGAVVLAPDGNADLRCSVDARQWLLAAVRHQVRDTLLPDMPDCLRPAEFLVLDPAHRGLRHGLGNEFGERLLHTSKRAT